MKKMLLLLATFVSVYAWGGTYHKLAEVNKCWTEQNDVVAASLPDYGDLSEREWIHTHLVLVRDILSNRSTQHLTPAQRANRQHCLDVLGAYADARNFPINEDYTYRTPIFIDHHDNFCAVGYLLKATGYEAVSRKISAQTNLAYVRSMRYPELAAWAQEYGFSIDELAWIQPGYPPKASCAPMGNGVNGQVHELFVDNTGTKLYVGGLFTTADGAVPASSIAYVTESGGAYTWHSMGAGVSGLVNAIQEYDGKIFVGGQLSATHGGIVLENAAVWNGSTWQAAGFLSGTVKDLIVYNGDLYAAGCFGCEIMSSSGHNFAKWNSATGTWVEIDGLTGSVNTMEVVGGELVLGGSFTYGSTPANIIRYTASGFQTYANALNNEVKDIAVYQDTLHAICMRTHTTDTTTLFVKLRNNTWTDAFPWDGFANSFLPVNGQVSFNTLAPEASRLNLGGRFFYAPMLGFFGQNSYAFGSNGEWMQLDSTVNKMVLFKGNLISGGAFIYGNASSEWGDKVMLNGIALRQLSTTSIPATPARGVNVYPNPVNAGGTLTIDAGFRASHYRLQHITGQLCAEGSISNTTLTVPALAPGMYLLSVSNDAGEVETRKVVVR